MEQANVETLVNFFKVLGNETRLRIIGMLANGDRTVGELAEALDLREPTVSEHLAKLKELELVTVKPEGNFRRYSFNPKPLYMVNRELFTRDNLAAMVDKSPQGEETRILRAYVRNDRIVQFPTTSKRWAIVLGWLAEQFELNRQYTEKEISELLKAYNEDFATLRRVLIVFGFMTREKGVYWRTPDSVRVDFSNIDY